MAAYYLAGNSEDALRGVIVLDIGSGYSVVQSDVSSQKKEEKPLELPSAYELPELQIVPVETERVDYNTRRIKELEKELGIDSGLEDLIDED